MTIKKKTLTMVGVISLAAVMLLSATFAWYTANDSVTNHLATKDALANVSIRETFVSPDDWKPGQTITKEAGAINTGTAPAMVRIALEEVLKVYQPPVGETAKFNAALETAGRRPQLFDASSYTPIGTGATDWVELTTTANTVIGGVKLAASVDAKVYAKYSPAATTGSSIDSWEFAIWSPITGTSYTTMNQAVTYDKAWDQATKTLSISNVKYLTYGAQVVVGDPTPVKWTAATIPSAANVNKSKAESLINANALVTGNYPNNIVINYDQMITALTGTSADAENWYYNSVDGYFYYIGLVAPGTATKNLLSSLKLSNTANSDYYANMSYDLIVTMEAIQHTKDAIASEWTGVAGVAALKTALEALCES